MSLCQFWSPFCQTLSDSYFCLSYEKINNCKIANSIIKTTISSDRRHFLVCIYVSKVSLLFKKYNLKMKSYNEISDFYLFLLCGLFTSLCERYKYNKLCC